MSAPSLIILAGSPKQVFELAQQLLVEDKAEMIQLLEQEQYANTTPEEHKHIVISRIRKYGKNAEFLTEEKQALKMINEM